LQYVADGLRGINAAHGADAIAALVSPQSTLEEMALTAQLVRGLGSDNIDFRLRQSDFRADGKRSGGPWLGMQVADLNALDRILVVGSFLRKDHPLVSARIRQAVKKGAGLNIIHATDDNLLMPVRAKAIVGPDRFAETLAGIVVALARLKGVEAPAALASIQPAGQAQQIAASLAQGKNVGVFLGNFAVQHADYTTLHSLAQEIARLAGGRFGLFGEAANSAGGYLAGAVPMTGGNARTLFEQPRRAYLLVNLEPEFDCANPAQAAKALAQADMVVALSPYKHGALDYADVLLPIAPFTETAGTFINCEGRAQSFNGVVRPLGETRPAWKVLRVLGNLLELPGFDYDTSEAVRDGLLGRAGAAPTAKLANELDWPIARIEASTQGLQRVAEVPIYSADPLVRRAPSLQQTADARPAHAAMNGATAARLGLTAGARARISQGGGDASLPVMIDERLPADCIRVPAALAATAGLGAMTGAIDVERA
jgi:NADH-quinone oxidoreductase subunit G